MTATHASNRETLGAGALLPVTTNPPMGCVPRPVEQSAPDLLPIQRPTALKRKIPKSDTRSDLGIHGGRYWD
jgi:hypothetical protein